MLCDVNIDNDAMINGRWFSVRNSQFKIAHVSNPAFVEAINRCGIHVTVKQLCQAMSQFLLLDWKDVKQPDGSDLPFNAENSFIAISRSDEVREFVEKISGDISKFQG